MSASEEIRPPRKTAVDHAFTSAKVGLSALLPSWLGAATVQAIEDIFGSPHAHKLQAWRETIAEAITQIQREVAGLRADVLQRDRTFQQTVRLATEIASASDPAETYPILKRALVSAANEDGVLRDMAYRVLVAMQSLSPTHIRILRFFARDAKFNHYKTLPPQPDAELERLSNEFAGCLYVMDLHGVEGLGLAREETKVFIDDLLREGLLESSDGYSRRRSPVTVFGKRLLELLEP